MSQTKPVCQEISNEGWKLLTNENTKYEDIKEYFKRSLDKPWDMGRNSFLFWSDHFDKLNDKQGLENVNPMFLYTQCNTTLRHLTIARALYFRFSLHWIDATTYGYE